MIQENDALSLVEAITAGLDGQRISPMMRRELARRLEVLQAGAGDPGAAACRPEPAHGHRVEVLVAQAVAIATGGRARGIWQSVRESAYGGEWLYSGMGERDWEGAVEEVGADVIARRVAWLMSGHQEGWRFEAGFGGRRRAATTLAVRMVSVA